MFDAGETVQVRHGAFDSGVIATCITECLGFVVFCQALLTEQANQELIARHGNDGIMSFNRSTRRKQSLPKLPLTAWFQAMYFPTQNKNNVAILELRHLNGIYRFNRRFDLAAMSK